MIRDFLIAGMALLVVASPSTGRAQTSAKTKVDAILQTCRAAGGDEVFRAAVGCLGVEEDPEIATETLDLDLERICGRMNGYCSTQNPHNAAAAALAQRLECPVERASACHVASKPFNLCNGALRVEDAQFTTVNFQIALSRPSGRHIFYFAGDPSNAPGDLQRRMEIESHGSDAAKAETLAEASAYVAAHCGEFSNWRDDLMDQALGRLVRWLRIKPQERRCRSTGLPGESIDCSRGWTGKRG